MTEILNRSLCDKYNPGNPLCKKCLIHGNIKRNEWGVPHLPKSFVEAHRLGTCKTTKYGKVYEAVRCPIENGITAIVYQG